jgi:hypothetical protein
MNCETRSLITFLKVIVTLIIVTFKDSTQYKSHKRNSEMLFCSGYLGMDDQNSTLKSPLLYTYHYLI